MNIVSFPPLNYPPSVLAVLLVVVLVVVLLSCCCRCFHLLCCRVANTAAAVGKEDDACYMNTHSSPATTAQTVCRALDAQKENSINSHAFTS